MSDVDRIPWLKIQKACLKAAETGDDTDFFELCGDIFQRQEEYKEYLQTNTWYQKKQAVLLRAHHTCEMCGLANTALEVHHLEYAARGEEALADLLALCPSCHSEVHTS